MDAEKIRHHIKHLQEMHDDLGKQIEEDYKHYADDAIVRHLKKKKLQLQDEIAHFNRRLEEYKNQ